jgi:hypothetical protein
MNKFDEVEVRRPAVAESYMALLAAQPGRPLALFAPRRVGKTYFLDHDLAPLARAAGKAPVYADLWLHKSAPLDAINHALEEALDDLSVPPGALGKLGKTTVRKVGALGASLELGDPPRRRALPDAPALRLDALVGRVARERGGQVLLMLDEVQSLVDAPDGAALVATLRAVLHQRRDAVCAVFTGSSQQRLARLMNTAGAPMYQFAQMIDFPFLGDEFLGLLAGHFSKVHPGKRLDPDALREVFARIGFKPALMRDIVKGMSAEGITDIAQGLEHYMTSEHQVAIWLALLHSIDAFEQGVLMAIANGLPPLSQGTLELLAAIPGARPTISKVRTAIERLKRKGLLSKIESGTRIDDPLFAAFLLRRNADPGAGRLRQ